MVAISLYLLIPASAQKIGQLYTNKLGHVPTHRLFYIGANHLKKAYRLVTDFIDQLKGFCYNNFHLHGSFFFFMDVLADTP